MYIIYSITYIAPILTLGDQQGVSLPYYIKAIEHS